MSRAKLQVSHELQEQEPDDYAFFVRLSWECKDVCPGEVTSTQELRAVSSLRMHSDECTVQQTQGIQLFIRTA